MGLFLLAALLAGDTWKPSHVAVVIQHSGSHRPNGQAIRGLLNRLLDTKPETAEVTIVGFEHKFEQLEPGRFHRKPEVLLPPTSNLESLKEALANLYFNGPSPVYDAVERALESGKPGLIVLVSNGVDNASAADFDQLLERVGKAEVPVVSLYFPLQPPSGGDSRLRKLAKTSGGKYIDIRNKDAWDQLLAALR